MIWFPFCTDNVNSGEFDPGNPSKHVRYGEGPNVDGGKCPSSHPYALPQIQLEVYFDTEKVQRRGGRLVLAPGDTTGYGFHADFVNGWEGGEKSLAEGIKLNATGTGTVCGQGFGGKPCFDELSVERKNNCRVSQFRHEEVQTPGKHLPGCNPVYPETKACSQQSENPPKSTTKRAQSSRGGRPLTVDIGHRQNWYYRGCFAIAEPQLGSVTASSTECAQRCASEGNTLAATWSGDQCQCGNGLRKVQGRKVDDSHCNVPCEGSQRENCGGINTLSVYMEEDVSVLVQRRSHSRSQVPRRRAHRFW